VQFQAQAGDKITHPVDKWSEYVSCFLFGTVHLQGSPWRGKALCEVRGELRWETKGKSTGKKRKSPKNRRVTLWQIWIIA